MSDTRLRWVVKYTACGPSPTCEDRNIELPEEWGVLKTTAIQWTGWREAEHKVLPEEFWGSKHLEVHEGDVIVTKAGPRQRVGVSAYVGKSRPHLVVSGKMILLRVDESVIDPRYLNWQLSTPLPQAYLNACKTGMAEAQMNFANEDLLGMNIKLPPLSEQRRIADFLDAETARIDGLVQNKRRIISLLEERVQSVVNELTPGPMVRGRDGRPAGIAGMSCVRLGALAVVEHGFTRDDGRDVGTDSVTLSYLRVANVQDGSLALDDVKEVTLPRALAERCTLRHGDVLMTEGGDPDKLGRGTVWSGEIKPCLHQNAIFAVRPDSRLLPEYLALVTRTAYARSYFEMTATKSTGIAHTSSTRITGFRVPMRNIAEQQAVVQRVREALAKIEALRAPAERQISLLAERRQALITAAVTGEIDVTTASGRYDASAGVAVSTSAGPSSS